MGKHSLNDDKGRRHRHKERDETEEERLLRKARDYVERHKDDDDRRERKSNSNKSRHDDPSDSRRGSKRSERKRDYRHDSEGRSRKKYKRDRSDEEESERHERRSRKDDKKKRKKKDSKRRKHDKRHKKLHVRKSDLYPLGEIKGSPPAEPLDVHNDYFAFHQHLWVYLYRDEGIAFGDLTSEEAHSAFKRFVKRYNAGELEAAYYTGLPPQAVDECKTTTHNWSFNTSETERKSLNFLLEGVRKQTEYEGSRADIVAPLQKEAPRTAAIEAPNERKRLTEEERKAERAANRRLRDHVRTAEEELVGGRKDGRERQIEKRKERAEAMHGAAKDREDARVGGVELNDEAIYGSGDKSFQEALARERQRKAQQQQKKQDRLAELQKKEQEKQEAMIKMLGLTGVKPGQKIKIAPRNDR